MLKKRADLFIQFFMILGIILVLVGAPTQTVQAVTCTWQGSEDTDWFNAANWEGCYFGSAPIHPGVDHDVVIPAGKPAIQDSPFTRRCCHPFIDHQRRRPDHSGRTNRDHRHPG